MTRYILVVAALFSVACAADLDWRIIGGSKADDGQFPYQVSLRQYGRHECGGSIISEGWVLTAAHCVAGVTTSAMAVVTGSNQLNSGGDIYEVSRCIVHKGYDRYYLHNDIALLKIRGKISLNDKVQTIPLETADVGAGVDLVLSGWGRTSNPGSISNDLQFLALKTISSEDCSERHVNASGTAVDSTQLCTLTQRGEGACHGDSGGPLAHEGKVAGIVSWGRPCARGYPDVFTRVSSYIAWISENMQ